MTRIEIAYKLEETVIITIWRDKVTPRTKT